MTDQTLLAQFVELFRGRSDAYGLVHGQAVRMPVTAEVWAAHLYGEGSLGIYPVDDGRCRWACTDIDLHGPRGLTAEDAWVHATNLQAALKVLGHRAWIELTKSHGYHVWLFATEPVNARVMRSVLLLAHQLADVPVVEVNPKDAEGRTELGNYVNLPYARAWCGAGKADTRHMVDPEQNPWPLSDFVELATELRSAPSQLAETAGLYVPPAPRSSVTLRPFSGALSDPYSREATGTSVRYDHSSDISDEELRSAVERLSGRGWIIFRDGPNQGGRGFTLFRLGVECRESGLSPDEALVVLVDADWRWGKFMTGTSGHTNGIRYIEKIVGDVYG